MEDVVAQVTWGIIVLLLVIAFIVQVRRKRRGVRTFDVGPGAYGSVYDLLNQDKRNAVEIIVEEKAEARDPEDADGNLPELERPRRANRVSEPRERSEPAQRRARERAEKPRT